MQFSAEALLGLRQVSKGLYEVLKEWPARHLLIWSSTSFLLIRDVCRNQVGPFWRTAKRRIPIMIVGDYYKDDKRQCRPSLRVPLTELPAANIRYVDWPSPGAQTFSALMDSRYLGLEPWGQTVSSTFRLTVNFNFKDMESPKQFMERLKFRECYNCSITGREIKGEDRRRLRDEFCQRWTAQELLQGLLQLDKSKGFKEPPLVELIRQATLDHSTEYIAQYRDRFKNLHPENQEELRQALTQYENLVAEARARPTAPTRQSKRIRQMKLGQKDQELERKSVEQGGGGSVAKKARIS
jgi:hypothetical protein